MKLYKLDVANIPDELFNKETDVKKWLELTTTSKDTFPPNSLNKVSPIANDVHIERILGIHLYMLGNILPFVLPILSVAALFSDIGMLCLKAFLSYFFVLYAVIHYYYFPYFQVKYKRQRELANDIRDNQYLHTERNTAKYCSTQFVWSETIQRPALDGTPVIFCAIPHGAAPLGITSYPVWSKIFNDKICHWTCSPIVLKLPLISSFMKKIGYIPAKANMIVQTLTKKEENVGIILDGISGMFQGSNEEKAYIQQRKGIVKIALRAGAPLVPVYCFGHTSLWRVVVDAFGILEKLSVKLDVSLCPFFGRWGWFLGPPRRVAVCVCVGEPVKCPKIAEPTQQDIEKYHTQLVKNYQQLFDQHKEAYGWGDKHLKICG